MAQSGCTPESLSAGSIGFVLAPRINAAGRMGEIELAMDLFFTEDPQRGEAVASRLCSLNKQRQDIELEIHQQVEEMLAGQDAPGGHCPVRPQLAPGGCGHCGLPHCRGVLLSHLPHLSGGG